jgi:hypothetical protein
MEKKMSLTDKLSNSPEILYHYTTNKGFLGIIKARELHASHILFLNDSTEFNLAFNLLREALKSKKIEFGTSRFLNSFIQEIRCVLSFTDKRDDLYYWRAYANTNPGLCIGFDINELRKELPETQTIFSPVVYDEIQQKEIIGDFLEDVLKETGPALSFDSFDDEIDFLLKVCPRMMDIAPLIKNHKFKIESEYRLVIKLKDADQLQVKEGNTRYAPYHHFHFNENAIKEIIVGPCAEPELTLKSVLFACIANDIVDEDIPDFITSSEVPYRNY